MGMPMEMITIQLGKEGLERVALYFDIKRRHTHNLEVDQAGLAPRGAGRVHVAAVPLLEMDPHAPRQSALNAGLAPSEQQRRASRMITSERAAARSSHLLRLSQTRASLKLGPGLDF